MNKTDNQNRDLNTLRPILASLGITLIDKQVHIGGERWLWSGQKSVLLGMEAATGRRVVVKASRNSAGIREIENERECRQFLSRINFAYHVFQTPAELKHAVVNDYTVAVTEFIPQTMTFLERPLKDQFFLALKAFEALEGVHATTYEHAGAVKRVFGSMNSGDYRRRFDDYGAEISPRLQPDHPLHTLLREVRSRLERGGKTIDRYAGFLTHWDLVPHNFRINDRRIYLLDHTALRFGNKYESWARFINFMSLYHPELELALLNYVRENRGEDELGSLKLMRLFRAGELIRFYTDSLDRADGDLRILNSLRVDFWTAVMSHILNDEPVPPATIENYRRQRDVLRSEDEKERQKGLH